MPLQSVILLLPTATTTNEGGPGTETILIRETRRKQEENTDAVLADAAHDDRAEKKDVHVVNVLKIVARVANVNVTIKEEDKDNILIIWCLFLS